MFELTYYCYHLFQIDLELIKSTEYVPPPESNMNGGGHYSHILSHHNQSRGRIIQRGGGEWENVVNGRCAKSRSVPAPTLAAAASVESGASKRKKQKPQMDNHERLMMNNNRSLKTTSKAKNQRLSLAASSTAQRTAEKVKGVVGYQSATACYAGGGGEVPMHHDNSAVYGVYSETKYTFSVNGMPGTSAQASAAAAFFARYDFLIIFLLIFLIF